MDIASVPPAGAPDHHVELYETEEFLVETVADFAAPALLAGDAVVVVATPEHRAAFAAALGAAGVDVRVAVAEGRFVTLDAADTLARFMTPEGPDPARFAKVVGGVLDAAGSGGRALRVYGEMVALLWADGDVAATIALEDLWNDLRGEREFALLCAYPLGHFDGARREEFRRICGCHGAVVPAEGWSRLGSTDAQQREVAELQQQVSALRAQLALLRRAPQTPALSASAAGRPARRRADTAAPALADAYLSAILAGDGAAAEGIVLGALAHAEPAGVYTDVVGAAMHELGTRWASGTVTVAQEHLATAVTERVLASAYATLLRAAPRSGPRFVLAGIGGERHVIGLRMVADLLEADGFSVDLLGADVPAPEILATVRHATPAGLGLTISAASDPAALHEVLGGLPARGPRVLVGGSGAAALDLGARVQVVTDLRELAGATAGLAAPHPTRVTRPPAPTPSPPAGVDDPLELLARASAESADIARRHARRAFAMGRAAMQDPLTGLANRRGLEAHLEELEMRRDGAALAIAMLDLDDFKAVNDELGHEAGDALLRIAALTIRSAVRPGDLVARIGGDEFCVLLEDAGPGAANEIADRIRAALAAAPTPRPVRASIGIADGIDDPYEILARADAAMYAAKRAAGTAPRDGRG